ncbi:hypothetical protein GCM10023339_28150 [Alloalcanivorax gelatiniphagus]
MNPIRTAAGVITHPVRTAGFLAGASLGVARTGVRTTARVVGWAVERATGPGAEPSGPWPTDPVDETPAEPEERAPIDPMLGTRTPAPAAEAAAAKTTEKPAAKKATATKSTAKKTASKTASKTAKKSARRAPSKKAAVMAPALGLTETEAEDLLRTPSGIPAAGDGYNPDTTETDLHQPGTEPIMDPATVKAAASEAAMMSRAADPDKG